MSRYLKAGLLIIALSLAACASNPPQEEMSLTEQGYNAMQAGNMEEAERLLTQAVDEDPNNLQALYNLGRLYQKTDRPDMAREYYQRVIAGEPDAEMNGQDPEQAKQLAQLAQENIDQMDREAEEAMKQAEADKAAEQPAPAPEPAPAPVMDNGYFVQTGAYAIAANADAMRNKLMGRYAGLLNGKKVFLVELGGLTKVRVGPYATKRGADNACVSFKRAGVDCFRPN